MHTNPEYTLTGYDEETPKDHGGTMGSALFGSLGFGFLIGLALLVARNWFLFS